MAGAFSLHTKIQIGNLHRLSLFALSLFLAACASSPDTDSFKMHWGVLMPVHDYLYLGDDLPECTDAEANMLAYRRDHTLEICTGGEHGHGWQEVVIDEPVTCNTCHSH